MPKKFDKRKILYKQCGGICPQCGRKMSLNNPRAVNSYMTFDHIMPQAYGGTSNIENLRPLCRKCNMGRGSDLQGVSAILNDEHLYVSKIFSKRY